jgi:23S rRNA (cytosine1962-C5)-methyltransferase
LTKFKLQGIINTNMSKQNDTQQYRLLDCGNQKKVEMLGDLKVIRPCPQAMWEIENEKYWQDADAEFGLVDGEKGKWKNLKPDPDLKRKHQGSGLPSEFNILSSDGIDWIIEPNEYGNIGVFTEHWMYGPGLSDVFAPKCKVLNLFTYSGSNCVALAKKGYRITAVDSSKASMDRYSQNLDNNNVSRGGQRFILEDAYKFVAREGRRGEKYGAIMIDAPSYGRGTKGEVFKIEDDLVKLLKASFELLERAGYMVVTLHSPRFTPAILQIMMSKLFPSKTVTAEEIVQKCESGTGLPSGFLVRIF